MHTDIMKQLSCVFLIIVLFANINKAQTIPNGDFEEWDSIGKPIGWISLPSVYIIKSTDHYTGNFSVEIEPVNSLTNCPCFTTGKFDKAGNVVAGLPFDLKIDTLTGYFKYIGATSQGDYGLVSVTLQTNGKLDSAGYSSCELKPTTSWTYFEVPVNAFVKPDTMQVDFNPSAAMGWFRGSILLIDDLQLKSQLFHASGIAVNVRPAFDVSAFPNPAQNQLSIRFGGNIPSEFGLKIYNNEGRLMIDNEFNSGGSTYTLPIEQLCAGLYFYEITANGLTVRNKFVKSN